MRSTHFHAGIPPATKGYDWYLWQAIELAMKAGKKYVYCDWKQHWHVSDERPNTDHWEVSGNDVVCVSWDE